MAKKKSAPKPKRIPQRTCIACRQPSGKRQLIRLVRTASGVEIDLTGKQAGRGAYLCNDRDCWQKAVDTNRIAPALRTAIGTADLEKISEFMDTHLFEKTILMDKTTMENNV